MVLVFDVNETLLDLGALDPIFEQVFGDDAVRAVWFAQVLQSAMALTLTRRWADFGEVAKSALDAVARQQRVTLTAQDRAAVFGGMRTLPPHPDVRPALERLKAAGVRMAALSNSPAKTLAAQLEHAGLNEFFGRVLSVDRVLKFKPHPEVYRMACRELRIGPREMMLVAAHGWDTTGAVRAGCRAAFVARGGKALSSLDERVDVTGRDLGEVAAQLLR
jgi:2-haloacid dehalogenase